MYDQRYHVRGLPREMRGAGAQQSRSWHVSTFVRSSKRPVTCSVYSLLQGTVVTGAASGAGWFAACRTART